MGAFGKSWWSSGADLVKEVQVVGHEHHGTAGQEPHNTVLEDVARHLRRQIDSICIVASQLDYQ